jgi:hypothetical protein
MPIAGPSKQKALPTTRRMVARGPSGPAAPKFQKWQVHQGGPGASNHAARNAADWRDVVGKIFGCAWPWPQASAVASPACPCQEGEGRGQRGKEMSRRPVMSALARTRARNRALRAEMVRLTKLAEQGLAELDDFVASRLRQLKAEMAAAHPDHGGTSEAFIAARERYLGAKRISGVWRPK